MLTTLPSTRDAILDAVDAQLGVLGYRKLTVDDVAQAAGMLPPEPARSIRPDLAVTGPRGGPAHVVVGVAEIEAPSHPRLPAEDVERIPFVEIRDRQSRALVTVIELLSPSNKASGSQGRRLYQQKQGELLGSKTHLLEIDLLRAGAHTVAAPLDYLVDRGSWDYLVCLHRGDQE